MTNTSGADTAFRMNTKPLLVGGVLMGLAGLLGLAGMAVAGTAVAAAARDWANRQEVPPTEVAKHHWHRVRAATVAGANTWRNGGQESVPQS
ncbi:MAG: hypothetical protein ACLPKI_07190 [Streptosporangiaceae bacterium]